MFQVKLDQPPRGVKGLNGLSGRKGFSGLNGLRGVNGFKGVNGLRLFSIGVSGFQKRVFPLLSLTL